MTFNREDWERYAAMMAEKHNRTIRQIVYDELGDVVDGLQRGYEGE